jgi:hypothetical protein
MRCYFGNILEKKLGNWELGEPVDNALGTWEEHIGKQPKSKKSYTPNPPSAKEKYSVAWVHLIHLIRNLLVLILYLVFFPLFFLSFDLTYILPSKVVLLMNYEPPPCTYIFTTYLSTYLSTSLLIYYYLCTYLSIFLPIFLSTYQLTHRPLYLPNIYAMSKSTIESIVKNVNIVWTTSLIIFKPPMRIKC